MEEFKENQQSLDQKQIENTENNKSSIADQILQKVAKQKSETSDLTNEKEEEDSKNLTSKKEENEVVSKKESDISSAEVPEIKDEKEEELSEKSEEPELKETPEANEVTPPSSENNKDKDETPNLKEEDSNEIQKAGDDDTAFEDSDEEEEIDYSEYSKKELVATLQNLVDTNKVSKIKDDYETIKALFYKKHHEEIEEKRKEYFEQHKDDEEVEAYKPEPCPLEAEFKEVSKIYKEKRAEYIAAQEKQKQDNLQIRQAIIAKIENLINTQDSLGEAFTEFKKLQEEWTTCGPVAPSDTKKIWEKYNFQVEKFYDYVKINKELRDLDLKKNLELKIKICEKAEELILEPMVVKAFKELQKLHNQWRDIGPAPHEKREEIWQRFKEATTNINKRHQEYFDNLKKEQEQNLQLKTELCEKIEELAKPNYKNSKEWRDSSDKIIEIQKLWKTIGFAPRKDNNKIYQRFREACDVYFDKKRAYFEELNSKQDQNLQLKTELCIQAEGLKDSEDWKNTTFELIDLQKRWKEIGPVSKKHSDEIWKRFRGACNQFFDRKKEHFATKDQVQEDNMKMKKDLIEQVKNFEFSDETDKNLQKLKEFQSQWTEIGFVPIKFKDQLQNEFRNEINARFDQLKVDDNKKSEIKLKNKLELLQNSPKGKQKIRMEKERIVEKLRKLESDITLWENNIGFFAKSKNADALIKDIEIKIDKAKKNVKSLKLQLRILNKPEENKE